MLVLVVGVAACSDDDDDVTVPSTTTVRVEALPAAVLTHGPFFFLGDAAAGERYATHDPYIRALVPDDRTYAYADSSGNDIWFVGPTREGVDIVWIDGAELDAPIAGSVETAFVVEEVVAVADGIWLVGDAQMAHVVRVPPDEFELNNVVGIGGEFAAAVGMRTSLWVANDQGELIEYDAATGDVLQTRDDLEEDLGTEIEEDVVVDLDVFDGDVLALTAAGRLLAFDPHSLAVRDLGAPSGAVMLAATRTGDTLASVTAAGEAWVLRTGQTQPELLGRGLPADLADLAVRTEGAGVVRVAASATSGIVVTPAVA